MELIEIELKSVGVFLSQCETVGVSPQAVLTYLDDGYVVMAARTMQIDAIDETLPPIPLVFQTDGFWIWTRELTEYVNRHQLGLPLDFLRKVKNIGGQIPVVTETQGEDAAAFLRGTKTI